MKKFSITYEEIISIENLLSAWEEFVRDKRRKPDVQNFSLRLMENIIALHEDLRSNTYNHSRYKAFKISDPKPRQIHKASVRDRLLHHAIHRKLYPFFDKKFIADSYSCRLGKGTHKAMERFQRFFWKVSKNNTRTCWVLKCDIRKFFASVDQGVLIEILKSYSLNPQILWLLEKIIKSFNSGTPNKGLPLGNLTSQLLVNIYMNEFDQFVKHELKAKYYIRYADDFVFLSRDRDYLQKLIPKIQEFLDNRLKLQLHPDKVYIKTFASGVDFLGWVHFPDHKVLRTTTKRRMMKKLKESNEPEVLSSYLGLLSHGSTRKIKDSIFLLSKLDHPGFFECLISSIFANGF